jgi:hypothetical protein
MIVVKKIKVALPKLPFNHVGIRFDPTQGAAAIQSARKGASGEVKQLSPDKQEILVELYWNDSPRALPGTGHVLRIWVNRDFFGQIFE